MIKISQPTIGQSEIDAVVAVLKSGMIAQGPVTAKFEHEFADFCDVKHAIATSNGTTALHCAMYAAGIKAGDEVITTPFTFVATANSILMQGGTPVFADIYPDTFLINPEEVARKITSKTKAILPVDLFGQTYGVKEINSLAKKHGLSVIEDACQAHGAEYNGKRAGSLGDIACFSLYATKNMATGEGGMITTNDDEMAVKCKTFRHHGQSETEKYMYHDLGYNYRLTDIASAIGLEQLKRMPEFSKIRIRNAGRLAKGLAGIKGLILPKTNEGNKHVFHQFTVRITPDSAINREELVVKLTEAGIDSGIFYPKPLHLHQCFKKYGYAEGDFPESERAAREVVSLPVHPLLTESEIDYIIGTIRKIYQV